MESGLEGRNNLDYCSPDDEIVRTVSMESGLEGRNNPAGWSPDSATRRGLNGVRPRRPEQYRLVVGHHRRKDSVSMESGLEGRNNGSPRKAALTRDFTSFCERFAPQTPITTLC